MIKVGVPAGQWQPMLQRQGGASNLILFDPDAPTCEVGNLPHPIGIGLINWK